MITSMGSGFKAIDFIQKAGNAGSPKKNDRMLLLNQLPVDECSQSYKRGSGNQPYGNSMLFTE